VSSSINVPAHLAELPALEPAASRLQAHSFLQAKGLQIDGVELALHVHILDVFRFRGRDPNLCGTVSGWVVGGFAPHLELSDEEIKTPVEALAIYALYMLDWVAAKGVQREDGSVPDYREPEQWEPLTYDHGFKRWHMGSILNFIAWSVLKHYQADLVHPDIRAMCVRKGWLTQS